MDKTDGKLVIKIAKHDSINTFYYKDYTVCLKGKKKKKLFFGFCSYFLSKNISV